MNGLLKNLDVVQVLSLGAIGLGFFLAILSYRLLTQEQKIKKPRLALIRAIYVYMGFTLVLIILGILGRYIDRPPEGQEIATALLAQFTADMSEVHQRTRELQDTSFRQIRSMALPITFERREGERVIALTGYASERLDFDGAASPDEAVARATQLTSTLMALPFDAYEEIAQKADMMGQESQSRVVQWYRSLATSELLRSGKADLSDHHSPELARLASFLATARIHGVLPRAIAEEIERYAAEHRDKVDTPDME